MASFETYFSRKVLNSVADECSITKIIICDLNAYTYICELLINQVTFNKVNLFVSTKVELQYQNVIKKFESFVFRINNI